MTSAKMSREQEVRSPVLFQRRFAVAVVLLSVAVVSLARALVWGQPLTFGQAASTRSFEAYGHYIEGMERFWEEEYKEGHQQMQEALRHDPDYIPALYAEVRIRDADPEAAKAAGQRLLSLLPKAEENWDALSLALFHASLGAGEQGDWDTKIETMRQALTWPLPERQLEWLRFSLLRALTDAGREREAFQTIEDWLAFKPKGSPEAFRAAMEEAQMLLNIGAVGAAKAILARQLVGERLSWKDVSSSTDTEVLASVASRAQAYEQAEEVREWIDAALRKLPEECPGAFRLQVVLAEALEREKKWLEAAKAYEDLEQKSCYCDSLIPHLLRAADIYRERLDECERAAAIYKRVLTDERLLALHPEKDSLGKVRAALREMGQPLPPERRGLREKSVWFMNLHRLDRVREKLLDAGYVFVSPPDAVSPLEQLCASEVVQPILGTTGGPWELTQDLLNYVYRGGGLLLLWVGPWGEGQRLAATLGFGIRPHFGENAEPAVALQQSTLALAGQGLKLLPRSALMAPSSSLLLAAEGAPVIGATEYGLGRVVVSTIGYWDLEYFRDSYPEEFQEEAPAFFLAALEWLRQGGQDEPALKDAFRSAHDAIARREYKGAIEALQAICRQHPDTPWEEQARCLMAQVFQQRLEDFKAARKEYETVFRKFPSGNTALAALMGRAACLEAVGAHWEEIRDQYRQVADMAPKGQMAATARVYQATLVLRHGDARGAMEIFRKAVEESPKGGAAEHALCGLAYSAEKAGDWASARTIYQRIADEHGNLVVSLAGFERLWTDLLLEGTDLSKKARQRSGDFFIFKDWVNKRLQRMEQVERSDILPAK